MRRNRQLPIWVLAAMFIGRLLVQRWWETRVDRQAGFAEGKPVSQRRHGFWGPFEIL